MKVNFEALENAKGLFMTLGIVALIFLLVGAYDYINLRQINKQQKTTIEQLKFTNDEINMSLIEAEGKLEEAKVDLEAAKSEKDIAVKLRKADLRTYTQRLRDLANANDFQRDAILQEFKNFKYEN